MTRQPSYVTVTDLFCGAGGSSIGAAKAGGEIRLGLNHWDLAIKTHNENFPGADHERTDIRSCDPSRYVSTTVLIGSPECRDHGLAKGKKRKNQGQLRLFDQLMHDPAEERSRATMWDIPRFAEEHNYQIVIVENVIEARGWRLFDAWIHAMELLDYQYEAVYFNSMFAWPTPQSRDRVYFCFWKKNLRKPNLKITPTAYCPQCVTNVASVQSWKNLKRQYGKYRQQYVYCCPSCGIEVIPYYYCAMNAIDWSIPAQKIGERKKPLKPNTMKRIQTGLEKFGRSGFLFDRIHTARYGNDGHMVWPLTAAQRTVIGQPSHGLVVPPIVVQMEHTSNAGGTRAPSEPMPTQTTTDASGVVFPPGFVIETGHAGERPPTQIESPLPTQTTRQTQAIIMPFLVDMTRTKGIGTPLDQPSPTQTATELFGLALPPGVLVSLNHSNERTRDLTDPAPTAMPQGNPFLVDLRGQNAPKPVTDVASTVVASGNHHGVVVPSAFITSYNSTSVGSGMDEPILTQDTRARHALIAPPFVYSYYTRVSGLQAALHKMEEPLPTVPGRVVHYLAEPGPTPAIEECGFRMLQPSEIQTTMAFPNTYKVFGTQREMIRQLGHAVTPPVMELLMERCLAILG
jgi:DNA (cytosine-5)-methyltransferase 1